MVCLEELRDNKRIRLEELRDKERVRLEERRILMEEERISIEREKLRIQSMVENERIMNKNTSGMFEAQKLYYEQRQEGILARQSQSKQFGLPYVNDVFDRPYFGSSLFISIGVFYYVI